MKQTYMNFIAIITLSASLLLQMQECSANPFESGKMVHVTVTVAAGGE